jgi:hypothetical protein
MTEERKQGITSALGRTNFTSGTRKVLTVDDPNERENSFDELSISDDREAELMAQLEAARSNKKKEKEKAPEGARNRLELLTGIARAVDKVSVDGITFSIRTLKSRENKEIIEAIMDIENGAIQAFETRAQTLARSIYEIDGQPFSLMIGSDKMEAKVFFAQELDESLLSHLYNKYTALVNKNRGRFDDLGKDEKEVIENVKKS